MPDLPHPQDDGLYIPTVGEWSHDKHVFLTKYLNAFTTSMKGKWGSLNYIDLFAGEGIKRLRDSGCLEWGSPLIAANAKHPFDGIHVCEKNKRKYEALQKRLGPIRPDAQILYGDANRMVDKIIEKIPQNSLSLAFLDPYGLHLDYSTLEKLAQRRADLIIFFPDHLDALRNWEKYYLRNPSSNLDRCLGKGADWRSIINSTSRDHLAEKLRELYINQIAALGYKYFEYERVCKGSHPLYVLIFCARHPFAAELWRKTSEIKPDGQRTFHFPPDS
jgi:three-Cys-motif partner protein